MAQKMRPPDVTASIARTDAGIHQDSGGENGRTASDRVAQIITP